MSADRILSQLLGSSAASGFAGGLAGGLASGLLTSKAGRKFGKKAEPFVARSSQWERASESGILRSRAALGARVEAGDRLGKFADPLGVDEVPVQASRSGIVIGRSELPLVNAGDALFHIATFDRPDAVSESVDEFQGGLNDLD